MTIVLSVITWIGILSVLIGSMFIGKFFYLKIRGNPTGEFTDHNFDQKYNSEGLGYIIFLISFFVSSYFGILIWIELLNVLVSLFS